MPFTSRSALSELNRWKGRRRAAYWRKLGFPNLVLAKKARWKGHVRKGKRAGELGLDILSSSLNDRAGFSVQPTRNVGATGSIWRRGCLVFCPKLEDFESSGITLRSADFRL